MTIPPFDPRFHLQHLHQMVIQYGSLRKLGSFASHRDFVLNVINKTVKVWDAKLTSYDFKDLKSLSLNTKNAVDDFAYQLFFKNLSPLEATSKEKANCEKMKKQLHNEIDTLMLAIEFNELASKYRWDINQIIVDERGRYLFKAMALAKNPWAIAHLEQMTVSAEHTAIEFAAELLIDTHLFNLNPDAICWLYEIIQKLDLSKHQDQRVWDLIVKPAIQIDNPDIAIQNLLIVYASEMDRSSSMYSAIYGAVRDFHTPTTSMPLYRQRLINRLILFPEAIELKENDIFPASWSDYNLKLRLCSKFMRVERDRRLIEFSMQSLQLGKPTYSPSSKCFPQAKGLIVGQIKGWEGISEEVAKQLVNQYEISIFAPKCKADDSDDWGEQVLPIEGEEQATLWIQDSCLMAIDENQNQTHILFPRFTSPFDIRQEDYVKLRTDRVRSAIEAVTHSITEIFESPDFSVLGRITSRGEQLMLLDQILQNSTSLRSLHNTMTFFEGGNLLIGKDEDGKPYVLVGADLIAINRRLLFKDMEALRIVKNSSGIWILNEDHSTPYSALTDEDICDFMASDLGLESRSQIHVIEQPGAFHLDMAMAIMGNPNGKKTVILNDSKLAAQVHRKMIESKEIYFPPYYATKEIFEKIEDESVDLVRFEKVAELQLREKGFDVKRVAGRFKSLGTTSEHRLDTVNFFNFVAIKLRSKGQEKYTQHIVIALGCSEAFQKRFKNMFAEHSHINESEIKFIFLNERYSETALKGRGGISCMTKILEELL